MNCQVAVSLSFGTERGSLPIDYRLYLPREWAEDQTRRHAAKVPIEIEFATKGDLALVQIETALAAGRPRGDRARGCRLWRRGRHPRPAECAGDELRTGAAAGHGRLLGGTPAGHAPTASGGRPAHHATRA